MLKRKGNRFTSLLLVLALVMTLLPPMTAFADSARIDINSLFVSAARPTGAEDNKVPRLTTNPIVVTAYINNISDAMVPNIYYEVENFNTGKIIVEKMNKAQVRGNLITFSNVYLSEGLNKVTIKLGETSVVSSSPGWAYFTPVTNISQLTINNVLFENDRMYPANMTTGSTNTSLSIMGLATNATDVQAFVLGDPNPKSNYFVNGNFSFIADHKSKEGVALANMFLNAGDNQITFQAKNNSNTYQLERRFIYDNGSAFAYHATIRNASVTNSTYTYLMTQPTVTYNNARLSAKIKIPLESATATSTLRLKYPKVRILAGDTNLGEFEIETATAVFQQNNTESKAGVYRVYNVILPNTTLSSNGKNKVLKFSFVDDGGQTVESTYSFTYTDPNLPYIHSANLALTNAFTGTMRDPGLRLNEFSQNSINELPKKLRIFGDDKTTGVNIYLNGSDTPLNGNTPLAPQATNSGETGLLNDPANTSLFLYQLDGLNNGLHRLRIEPVYASGRNESGSKLYELMVTSAPYVILNNIYNGMITKNKNLDCTDGCLSGRFVNVPVNELTNIEVTINDGVPTKFIDADFGDSASDIAANKTIGKFRFNFTGNSRALSLDEGRNLIKIYIYNRGQLMTLVTYEVFVYSTDAPDFAGSIAPHPVVASDRQTFIPAKNPDTYSTNEAAVVFRGKMTGATSLRVTARSKNAEGIPVWKSTILRTLNGTPENSESSTDSIIGAFPYLSSSSITPNTGAFATLPITLNPKGDTVFEFEITNASNIKVIRTITISREPLPYRVLFPTLIKNNKNEDQANINSNFQYIELEAEFADKVLFDKTEAVKKEGTNNIFIHEVSGLKAGKNTIKFTVIRGTEKTNGSIVLQNMDTSVEGASFKAKMNTSFRVFDGDIQLKFPKDTTLMRNEEAADHQYLTSERSLMFGIANQEDGRVDRSSAVRDPYAVNLLREPTLRFKPASKMFWIDTGTIPKLAAVTSTADLEKALKGSGRMPYSNDDKFYYRNPLDQVVPTQPGTLTLKYNAIVRNNAWKYLTVYHFGLYENKSGQLVPMWRNVGGVVNPSNNTITTAFSAPGYYQVMYMAKSFQDITNHPWAREDLDTLYSKGIMENKTISSFVPNDFITRGEFVTLLVKIFELPLNYAGAQTFEDVGLFKMDELADYKYIETAARAGIVRGLTETQFMPNLTITRQDAAVMIARAADLKVSNDPAKSLTALQKQFTDANGINIYARPSVEAITKAKLIEGKANVLLQGQKKLTYRFDPLESFTRAEAATVAIRVMKQQGKVPK